VDAPVAISVLGTARSLRRGEYFNSVGETEGVTKGESVQKSRSRMKAQLRALRGEAGVLGENQPSLLIVLVGDNGGVV
jgi:hypothetical protein